MQAIKVMKKQDTVGHIFNVDGAGATGNATPRFAAYGATKRGLEQLGKSLQVIALLWLARCEACFVDRMSIMDLNLCLQAELKMENVKSVCLHNLSPGMVTTELLMSGKRPAASCSILYSFANLLNLHKPSHLLPGLHPLRLRTKVQLMV